MPITVTPINSVDDFTNDVRLRTAALINEHVLPREAELWPQRQGVALSDERKRAARTSSRRSSRPASGPPIFLRNMGEWASTSYPTPI